MPTVLPRLGTRAAPDGFQRADTGPSDAAGRGLERLGRDVQNASARLSAIAAEEKGKADATQTSTAFAELGTNAETKVAEWEKLKPEDALREAPALFDAIEKDRRTILEKRLFNDEQRAVFEVRSRALMQNVRSRMGAIESRKRHEAQQEAVAAEQSIHRESLAKAGEFDNPEARNRRIILWESAVAAQFSTPQGKAAAIAEVRQQAAKIVLDAYLSQERYEEAEAYFVAGGKDMLGSAAPKYQADIRRGGAERRADALARAIVAKHKNDQGRLDVAAAREEFGALPAGSDKAAADKVFDELVLEEQQSWTAKVNARYSEAFSAYLRGGKSLKSIPPRLRDWLRDNAPERWDALEDEHHSNVRRWQESPTRAKSQQKRMNAEAEFEYRIREEEFARMDPKEVVAEIARQHPGVDLDTMNSILGLRSTAGRRVETGELAAKHQFILQAERDAEAQTQTAEDARNVRAAADAAWEQWRKANPTKPLPSAEEQEELRGRVTRQRIGRSWLGNPKPVGPEWKVRAGELRRGDVPPPLYEAAAAPAEQSSPGTSATVGDAVQPPATVRVVRRSDGKAKLVPVDQAEKYRNDPAFEVR